MLSFLRKTFLLYDDLPAKEFPPITTTTTTKNNDGVGGNDDKKEVVLTDAVMPDSPEEVMNELAEKKIGFPSDFYYGAATAAYQTEGGLDNCTWHDWEEQKFRTLGDGQPTVIHHERADRACDSWNEFLARDVPLMAANGCLGNVGMYRFSIEWSRIEPEEGRFDDEAIRRYRLWCETLLEHGIEPMVTLHHFTEPTWFDQKGGWEKRENVQYFERFVKYAVHHLLLKNKNKNDNSSNDRQLLCRYWSTINELNGFAICGWIAGIHPPGKVSDIFATLTVIQNLLLAHKSAYKAIHTAFDLHAQQKQERPIVCLPLNHVVFLPTQSSSSSVFSVGHWANKILSNIVSVFLNYAYNFLILDAVFFGHLPYLLPFPFHLLLALLMGPEFYSDIKELKGTADWIGVNHYYRSYVEFTYRSGGHVKQQASPTDLFADLPLGFRLRAAAIPNFEKNEMGWDLTPSSMKRIIQLLWDRYRPVPIIITESGTADVTDRKRVRYIYSVLKSLHEIMKKTDDDDEGVDLRGYLIWTLLDNFEWAEGFHPKFGLLETDFKTMERTERKLTCGMLRSIFPSTTSTTN